MSTRAANYTTANTPESSIFDNYPGKLNTRDANPLPRNRTKNYLLILILAAAMGLLVRAILLAAFSSENGRKLMKRDSSLGPVIGLCVGGTVVLVVLLSTCFIRCQRDRIAALQRARRGGGAPSTVGP